MTEAAAISKPDYAANLALFLLEKTGSIWGRWADYISANQQRELFGRFIGKGRIIIDGKDETLCNRVKVAFGKDWDDRNQFAWRDL